MHTIGWTQRAHDRARAIIGKNAGANDDIAISPLSSCAGRLILKARMGRRSFAIKAFNPEDDAARARFERELWVLVTTSDSALTPDLLGYGIEDALVVMPWIEAPCLLDYLGDFADKRVGIDIGKWLAQFACSMPHATASDNWYSYLCKYGELGGGSTLQDRKSVLSAMPIRTVSIAKNDGHLGNFLAAGERGLIGIDFAEARRKPLGWDVLLTARSLQQVLGGGASEVISGMIKGWCGAINGFEKAEFRKLVRLFLRGLETQAQAPAMSDARPAVKAQK